LSVGRWTFAANQVQRSTLNAQHSTFNGYGG